MNAEMKVAVIKYNAGNTYSVICALKQLGYECVVTDDPALLHGADKVIFPGVGEASAAMTHLRQLGLDKVIRSLRQPVLGICIGQQLLCRHSEEGDCECLGVFDADVLKFKTVNPEFRIPHTGWDTVELIKDSFMPSSISGNFLYYVHSYYVPVVTDTVAVTEYIVPFSAAMNHDNFYATQFHPEKSGDVGSQVLKSFLEL